MRISLGINKHLPMRLGILVLGTLIVPFVEGTTAVSQSPRVSNPDSCAPHRPNATGWRRIVSEQGGFAFAVPPEFRPDTSMEAGMATYHGGEQLTDGHRQLFHSYYRPHDLRLEEARASATTQSPGWPTLPNGWTLRVEQQAEAGEASDTGAIFLSAWLTSKDGAEHYAITGSATNLDDLDKVRAIICTLGSAK